MPETLAPYALLGVPPTATTQEIRSAFRRQALALHPDRNPSPDAQDAFLALHEAYDALMREREADAVSPDDVIREMERAAGEIERRRARAGADAQVWQQVRVPLTQPLGSRLRALMGSAEVWAVDVHWTGLRDLRWDVTVRWDEIRDVREQNGVLDVLLTPAGAARLAQEVELMEGGTVYRFPLGESSRLAGLIRQQIAADLAVA